MFAHPDLPRRHRAIARRLLRNQRAAAVVEMALVLPLLLTLLVGILVYGQYYMIAHAVQQAANDGARAALVGLDTADRDAIARRAATRSLQSFAGDGVPAVSVSETTDAITVAVAYTVPPDSFARTAFVPIPDSVVRARATFELPVD